MRPLHGALPGQQHRQTAEPQAGDSGRARLPERVWSRVGSAAAGQAQFAEGDLRVHHLRGLRIPMPGGHRAPAHHRGLAARRREHRRMAGRARGKAFSGFGARLECAGHQRHGARQICREKCLAALRRNAGILPMAGLHGRLRSQGPRDYSVAGRGDEAPRSDLRRAAQGEMHVATRCGGWATTCSSSNWRKPI